MLGLPINMFAVAVATLMSMALGVLWYSPMLFGRWWMHTTGISDPELESGLVERGWRFCAGFILHFVVLVSVAYLLRITALSGEITFVRAMITISALLIVAHVSAVIWEKKSIQYALVAGGYLLLFVWVGAGIITYWPW